jgi:hypothetical protein
MARKTKIALAPEYQKAIAASGAAGDNNDCFPTAIALLTGLDTEAVRKAFADAGRKSGQGTRWGVARAAVGALGYKMERLPIKWKHEMIATYPGVHKNLQNITTRHPARFAAQWAGQNVLLHVNGHVAAVVNGRMLDWSINRSMHVLDVYKIVKL